MKDNKTKRKISTNKSEEDKDNNKHLVEENDIGLNQDKSYSEDDFSDNSSMSDEIEEKINSKFDKNKKIFTGNDNINEEGEKNDIKKKVKYDQKVMKDKFNDYFDAYKNQIDDYYDVNYPSLSQYDFKIDIYSDLYKLIDKGKIFPSLLRNHENEEDTDEKYNIINKGNLFNLIYDLLFFGCNIFLYGFGNKMDLALKFIEHFHKRYYDDSDTPLYIISFNLNNSEMNFKVIINKIQSILQKEFEKYFNGKFAFTNEPTIEGQIVKLQQIYKKITNKLNNKENNLKNSEPEKIDNNNSGNDLSSSDEDEGNELKDKKKDIDFIEDQKLPFKILLVINNIGSSIGQSKSFQNNLSDMVFNLFFIKLFVTCENLVIPYYWTLEAKDKYKFCFLKYNTFEPYDAEIDENNSIKVGNNIKSGFGLKEIFSSFSEHQKKLMKEIAILNLKGDHDHLTPKGLVNYFIETGIGIITDKQKLETLITEAIDHEIVELKPSNENNKEIYKMNLEKSIIQKIADGEFFN